MHEISDIMNALSDQTRLRIVMMLWRRELAAGQIVELLGMAGSTVSGHLKTLRSAGLVESRRDGLWVHYRLPDPKSTNLRISQAIGYVVAHLKDDTQIVKDREKIEDIVVN